MTQGGLSDTHLQREIMTFDNNNNNNNNDYNNNHNHNNSNLTIIMIVIMTFLFEPKFCFTFLLTTGVHYFKKMK